MAGKYSWKDVAGTAKKWLDNKVTQTVTADRRTRQRTEAQEWQLEREMKEQAGGAVLTTAFPSLRRALERQEENRERAERDSADRARARRVASVVPGSVVELSGQVSGRLEDLAVDLTADDEAATLVVLLEPVDPAPLSGGTLAAVGFAISGFSGEGTYDLVEDTETLDPGVHHVAVTGDSEDAEFYWTPEYGRAVAVVEDGRIEAQLVCRNAASEEIRVTVRVPLAG